VERPVWPKYVSFKQVHDDTNGLVNYSSLRTRVHNGTLRRVVRNGKLHINRDFAYKYLEEELLKKTMIKLSTVYKDFGYSFPQAVTSCVNKPFGIQARKLGPDWYITQEEYERFKARKEYEAKRKTELIKLSKCYKDFGYKNGRSVNKLVNKPFGIEAERLHQDWYITQEEYDRFKEICSMKRISEVGQIIGVHGATIRRWLVKYNLPHGRHGVEYVCHPETVINFVAQVEDKLDGTVGQKFVRETCKISNTKCNKIVKDFLKEKHWISGAWRFNFFDYLKAAEEYEGYLKRKRLKKKGVEIVQC
jgi:hypothetical protein